MTNTATPALKGTRGMVNGKRNLSAFFSRLEDAALILILVGMVLLAFTQIVLRNIFGIGLVWIDPLVRQMLLWVTLVGAMVATRQQKHITVDALSRFLPPGRIKSATGCISNIFATIVCMLLTWSTFRVFHMEYQDPQGGYIMTGFPLWASLIVMPIAFGVMTLRFLCFSVRSLLHTVKGETAV